MSCSSGIRARTGRTRSRPAGRPAPAPAVAAAAGDRQRALLDGELDRARLHPRQLDDDDELRGVVGGEAVDGRPEAQGPAKRGTRRSAKKLLDLPLQAVYVAPRHQGRPYPSRYDRTYGPRGADPEAPRRRARLPGAYACCRRHAPLAKARKARRRAARCRIPPLNRILMCRTRGRGNRPARDFRSPSSCRARVSGCAPRGRLPLLMLGSGSRTTPGSFTGAAPSTTASTGSRSSASTSSASTCTGTRSRRRRASTRGRTRTRCCAGSAAADPGRRRHRRLARLGERRPDTELRTGRESFAAFARAAAARYRWVTQRLLWNEPNQARWLRPTSPSVYVRQILNPGYAAIHAVIRARAWRGA